MNTRNTDEMAPVADITFEELIRMRDSNASPHDCIVANTGSHMRAFRGPMHVDAFIIGVVTRGSITCLLNMQEYTLSKDMMFIIGPHMLVQTLSEENFNAHVVIVSARQLHRINIDTRRIMPVFLNRGAKPYFQLEAVQSETLRNSITMIERELREPENAFSSDILGCLVAALLYKVGGILNLCALDGDSSAQPANSRAEEYLRRFIELLGEYFRSERSVGFYARQLCVTPKYLTTLIRRVSGKSVSEWIDLYVVMEAKTQLRYSNRSIQEIAYLLNFPNQSFFGSYFRRLTGLSPSQFRNSEQ